MNKNCPKCKDAGYTSGTAIYDYYECGHALDKIDNKIVSRKSDAHYDQVLYKRYTERPAQEGV